MSIVCDKFREDPTVNPRTNRKIISAGKTYRSLVEECLQNQPCDDMGYGIFRTIDNKYRLGNKLFETERNKIHGLYETYQITLNGFRKITDVINIYESAYIQFINNVSYQRTYVEKSGSGNQQRQIKTPQDWGEAIIELVDLVDIFKRDLQTSISVNTNKNKIKDECHKTSAKDCKLPCTIKNPLLKSPYCDIK